MWLTAPNMTCVHGFSTRHGGVSSAPFDSLNMGGHEDDPQAISENRNRALALLGLTEDCVCRLKQVHGVTVHNAQPGVFEGDGLVTNEPLIALAIGTADCYPLLFHDATHRVIGAAHAGWRGTVGKIANEVLTKMMALGAQPHTTHIAIGPGISTEKFEVGDEVVAEFSVAGFPADYLKNRHIDLAAANKWVLMQAGVPAENIYVNGRCSTESDFFSYRRDNGITGRMWSVISMNR